MNDANVLNGMSYIQMQRCYNENFSIGHINGKIQDKFALIGLICYLTYKAKQKSPGITHWHIIKKISVGMDLPERFLMGLAIMCEDFSYGCTDFPTFGVDQKDIIKTVKNILDNYRPF